MLDRQLLSDHILDKYDSYNRFSRAIGYNPKTIRNILKDRSNPSFATICQMSQALSLTQDDYIAIFASDLFESNQTHTLEG